MVRLSPSFHRRRARWRPSRRAPRHHPPGRSFTQWRSRFPRRRRRLAAQWSGRPNRRWLFARRWWRLPRHRRPFAEWRSQFPRHRRLLARSRSRFLMRRRPLAKRRFPVLSCRRSFVRWWPPVLRPCRPFAKWRSPVPRRRMSLPELLPIQARAADATPAIGRGTCACPGTTPGSPMARARFH